ncbi:MAG TPA: hypothetical protein VMW62_11225 [Chloroflexota bacterium]|nr:hypothetical protein [Chloroflexota bacterium]
MVRQITWPHATAAALGCWAGRALLATVLATGLIFGPRIADAAWNHDTHVTPGQAMLHWALDAQGVVDHHHATSAAAARTFAATASGGASLSPGNSTLNFGTPVTSAAISAYVPCAVYAPCGLPWSNDRLQDLHHPVPDAPPPRTP